MPNANASHASPDRHAVNRLADYPVDVAAGDLYRDAPANVAAKWGVMADGLLALADDARMPAPDLLTRQILDLGMSFRITGDRNERPWPLSPMPLIIGAEEWSGVERGLVQRANLLERLVADIYGPQRLVREGDLPAAVVTGSQYFARRMVGLQPPGKHYLQIYAVDLARGPHGQWRILGDRLRLANGIGYVLENRLALSRVAGSLLSGIHARRLAHFFSELREGIARRCQRDNPRIALLTPGRFNQSYPEQAHLARYLGFPLVEGRDLTVSEDKLYIRTIGGPRRVDALWRWIDTNALDPLTFDSQSAIGVPDLFDAWARGGLEMANWPGVEVLEAPAFAAFLPRLCRLLLGEEPILPNIATWWCGQPREAAIVHDRLDRIVITPAFGQPVAGLPAARPAALAELDPPAREALLAAMARRPMDYCGQEIVNLSSTPTLIGDCFVPRAFTLRAFVARGPDGEWMVMPGGFARLSPSGEITTTLMGEGDLSADVCVVDHEPIAQFRKTSLGEVPAIQRGGSILASQAADNVYWFGRYCERAEMTVRIVRSILGNPIEVDAPGGYAPDAYRLLARLLFQWGAIDEADARQPTAIVCRAALAETELPGGVARLLETIREVGLTLRDRLAPDFWRIANRPMPALTSERPGATLRVARELAERFGALSGLIAENLVRGPVWRFLDMGRRIERGLALCRLVRLLGEAQPEIEAMSVLLDLCDSQITYRSRYMASPLRDPVLDLLLLDRENPRSLVFQVERLCSHIEALPRLDEGQLPEAPLRQARALLAPLQSLTVDEIDDALLQDLEDRLLALSDAITTRFFLQYDKPEAQAPASFLA